ncbi:hypothetical protein EYB26_001596 [Talaromyces marneffei]|uniref:uncharacterized protein n=1 Tax=Talaromyces marneffei TaxID=37727 RepID=UPI0012A8D457|nr:uncharacterized protein EYB26_001596 [Talaromyces marneffei]QGA13944.1 hypothetical protein EYB26_001596 [Talaromyces marneffei]
MRCMPGLHAPNAMPVGVSRGGCGGGGGGGGCGVDVDDVVVVIIAGAVVASCRRSSTELLVQLVQDELLWNNKKRLRSANSSLDPETQFFLFS